MCYSAKVWADARRYERAYGALPDLPLFTQLYERRQAGEAIKLPRGMDESFSEPRNAQERHLHALAAAWRAQRIPELEQEIFAQATRLAAAERKLATKPTKTAEKEAGIAGRNVKRLKARLADAKRTEPDPDRDDRIFPDVYAPVLVRERGQLWVRPMRYHCRPFWMPASSDRTRDGKPSGKYNARRDKLEQFWARLYGHHHALIVADVFYENVETPAGNAELRFEPRTHEPMLIACLWSEWSDPGTGEELLSFAAVTDEPMPEVAAAGHDRTIVNLRPEYVDEWLQPASRERLAEILNDPQRPYYEYRVAA